METTDDDKKNDCKPVPVIIRDPHKIGTNPEPEGSPSQHFKSFTWQGSPSSQNARHGQKTQNGQKAQKIIGDTGGSTSDTSIDYENVPQTVQDVIVTSKTPTPHDQSVAMGIEDVLLKVPETDKKTEPELEPELISPRSLLKKHILRGVSSIQLNTCCIILSGTNECEKSKMMKNLFNKVIKTADKKAISNFDEGATLKINECLTRRQLTILGKHPFDTTKLHWKYTSQDDTLTTCLLTYFVNVCLKRESGNYEQIKFVSESNNEGCPSEYKEIHNTLAQKWKKLQNDKDLQDCMKAGFTLINVIDIQSSRAVKDFLPFLNKYCNRSVHFTCYSKEHDSLELKQELVLNDNQYCNQTSKSNQLLKQLKGCMNEEQIVVVTPLSTTDLTDRKETEIDKMNQAIRERVGTQNVNCLEVTMSNTEDVKQKIEEFVKNSSFHFLAYLREFKLFEEIQQKSNGKFWMERSEIEEFSVKLKFKNGTFDRFLRFFTSFGSIFYTHDIPTLDEHVITDIPKFIECAHKLYQDEDPQNEVSKYGLFIDTNEDTRILLQYLSVLGIAVEVMSTQIEFPTPTNSVQNKYYYMYIPSARSAGPSQADKPNEDSIISIVLSFNDCIAENLQALLCNEALRLGGWLEATENHNTTVVRTCKNDASVQIADFGKDVKLTIIRDSDDRPIEEKIIETYGHLLSDYPTLTTKTGAKLRYKIQWFSKRMESQKDALNDALDRKTHKLPIQCLEKRPLNDDFIPLAAQLAQTYEHNMKKLQLAFKISTEEMGQYESYQSQMKVLCMINKFASRSTKEELEAVLKKIL